MSENERPPRDVRLSVPEGKERREARERSVMKARYEKYLRDQGKGSSGVFLAIVTVIALAIFGYNAYLVKAVGRLGEFDGFGRELVEIPLFLESVFQIGSWAGPAWVFVDALVFIAGLATIWKSLSG